YLIISASKATEPILAIIDSGNYQEDEQVNVEGFDYFMDAAISYVANADGVNGSDDDGPIDKIMEWYSDTLVLTNPAKPWKVEVCWGQYWPENIYCPNKIAGCSPVAIAQVLSYFKPEMSFDLTFDGRPYDHLTINWDEILKHNISTQSTNKSLSHLFSCDASSATHEELAALVRQIGVWANSEYKSNTTSTPISQKFYVVERFLTDYSKIYVRSGEIYDKLQDGGIALVSGWGKEVSHAWVIDGTASIIYRITHYTYYIPKTGEYATKEFKQETAKYLHCNWGWCGSSNGYFLEGVFDTKTGRDFPILQPADPGDLGTLSVSSRNEYDCVDGYIYK
ncbi:MAG: C10 family peptidase, partial [Muribaculaceae bacterium]|nr:C10 family peptidase [Muribaculaceae bacterium]